MKIMYERLKIFTSVLGLVFISCNEPEKISNMELVQNNQFDPNLLHIKSSENIKKVKGQLLYLPIYSNIPYTHNNYKQNLSAFLAIHNTDIYNKLRITKVLFFDNDGKLVADYQPNETVLNPLGATYYYVPKDDQSGTGANFLVEWLSDSLITEPLVESVMLDLSHGQGVSFLSTGKIIRELK